MASMEEILRGEACDRCERTFADMHDEDVDPPGHPRTCLGCLLEEEAEDEWRREREEFARAVEDRTDGIP